MSNRLHRARLWCERVAWRTYKLAHPYKPLPFRQGTGAWGRVTRKDRAKWEQIRADLKQRVRERRIHADRDVEERERPMGARDDGDHWHIGRAPIKVDQSNYRKASG